MNHISNTVIRQIFLLVLIVLLGFTLWSQLKVFLPALLGAYTLYILFHKYMLLLQTKYKWRVTWCAILLMFVSFLVIMLPILVLVNMLASKIGFAVEHLSEVLKVIQNFIESYEEKYDLAILTDGNIQKITSWGAENLPNLLGATLNTIITIGVMYFLLFFMFTQGAGSEEHIYAWLPIKTQNIAPLRKELNHMILSNAIGIPLIAFLQGLVGLIGYLIIGVPEAFFWFVVTCMAGLFPIVGSALAYIPLSLLLLADAEIVKGITVLIFGLAIIGSTDNIFRFWLQKKLGNVHPLITAFGVIVGVNLFGFMGLIFGPILISLFLLLLKVYAQEFRS